MMLAPMLFCWQLQAARPIARVRALEVEVWRYEKQVGRT
jgi:hypothetical protein